MRQLRRMEWLPILLIGIIAIYTGFLASFNVPCEFFIRFLFVFVGILFIYLAMKVKVKEAEKDAR